MNEADYGMLKIRLHEAMTAAQNRRIDGSDLYAENMRYSYLMGKDRVSFSESTAQRFVGESGSGKVRDNQMAPVPVNTPAQ